MKEILQESQTIYDGRILRLDVETVQLPNQELTKREIVRHRPAVAVLAVQDGQYYLIRQYRRAVDEVLIEVPAGNMEESDSLAAGKRELREETGITAKNWDYLGGYYLSPGFCDEYMYFYLATDLSFGDTELDDDESCELFSVDKTEFEGLLGSGKVKDAKTILAFQLAQSKLGV